MDEVLVPPEEIEDQIYFVVNNLTAINMREKVRQAACILVSAYFPWVADQLVERASAQVNFHYVYITFLTELQQPELFAHVRHRSLLRIKLLLDAPDLGAMSSTERTSLKTLGSWLGQYTLARDKPLQKQELDLNELLLIGYELGGLTVVVPFVAKILEANRHNKQVYGAEPWSIEVLRTLAEIYQLPDLKLTLRFSIELLCKAVGVELGSVVPAELLAHRSSPVILNNKDFSKRGGGKRAETQYATSAQRQNPEDTEKLHPGRIVAFEESKTTTTRIDFSVSSELNTRANDKDYNQAVENLSIVDDSLQLQGTWFGRGDDDVDDESEDEDEIILLQPSAVPFRVKSLGEEAPTSPQLTDRPQR